MRCSSRINESTVNVHNHLSAPLHHHAVRICNDGDLNCVKILCVCGLDKFLHVLFSDDNRHALLTFGNDKLGSVKSLVFFRHSVKVDVKTRGKLTHGNTHTTGTKIITAANHQTNVLVTEEPLDFSLLNGISLLNLSGGSCHGFFRMHL